MEEKAPEYSGNNAWYINFNNGNQNNNNKYNGYYLRPVADSHDGLGGGFPVSDTFRQKFHDDMIIAEKECFKGKSSSRSAQEYKVNCILNTYELAESILNKTWRPKPLNCFIVHYPTIREIFSSQFCDRIVDTYVSFRLEPLMDRILTKSATACRKGLGTSSTVAEAYSAMARCSEDFTRDCWVQTYDCQSYYMSINRELLLNMILSLFDCFWEGDPMEAEICKWLITLRLMTDYAKTARRLSPPEYWDKLPKRKSLFCQPEGFGVVIGLLLTNESANIYMAPIDYYVREVLGYGDNYGRNIDDCWMIGTDRQKMLHDMELIREKYRQFNLTLHPTKYYFQHYTKGFKVQNAIIKPGRIYLSNRPVTNVIKKIHWWNNAARENVTFRRQNVEKFVAVINSYLAQMQHYDEYKMRRRICEEVYAVWKDVLYPDRDNYFKLIVRRRWKTKSRNLKRMRKIRRKYHLQIEEFMRSQAVRNFGQAEKALPKEKINEKNWIGRARIEDQTEPETDEQGNQTGTRVVEGMKTWIEKRYDHEPTDAELQELEATEL